MLGGPTLWPFHPGSTRAAFPRPGFKDRPHGQEAASVASMSGRHLCFLLGSQVPLEGQERIKGP